MRCLGMPVAAQESPRWLTMPDIAMVRSSFERKTNDLYRTEPWVTEALFDSINDVWSQTGVVWEPACGHGDMAEVCRNHANMVVCSDIDSGNYASAHQQDFLMADELPSPLYGWNVCERAIITNPPYNCIDSFVNKAMKFDVGLVAILARSEWKHGCKRTELFTSAQSNKMFFSEIALTSRPRWDSWWDGDAPRMSPRHNFSWYVWCSNQYVGYPTIRFAGKKRRA